MKNTFLMLFLQKPKVRCWKPNIYDFLMVWDPYKAGGSGVVQGPWAQNWARALLGPICFWIFWTARGASLANLGHFAKFWPRPNFQLFSKRFSLITHLPPEHGGANPCKKMLETSDNLPKPSQNQSPGTKNQNPCENITQICFIFGHFLVAQWSNMRISPAYCLLPPCLQGSTQNPCLARRRRKAPCGGEGFQKSQYWPKFPSIQNSVLALAESLVWRGRFSEITILARGFQAEGFSQFQPWIVCRQDILVCRQDLCWACRQDICCACSRDICCVSRQEICSLPRHPPGHCGHRGGRFTTDVLAADTTDVLPADTAHVLPADWCRKPNICELFLRFGTYSGPTPGMLGVGNPFSEKMFQKH